jgi:hypothetical protein
MKSPRTALLLGLLAIVLNALDGTNVVHAGKRVLSRNSVRADLLDGGTLGKSLRKMNLVGTAAPDFNWTWGLKDRSPRLEVLFGDQPGIPDAFLVGEQLLAGSPSLLAVSLAIAPEHLVDPNRGILAHTEVRLEMPGSVALFRGQELLMHTRCGISLHGHAFKYERGWASFKVFLRDELGLAQLPQGVIQNPLSQPVDRFLVRGASITSSNLSFQVANRIGSPAPGMELCRLILNGEDQGFMSLTEHLTRRSMSRCLGHDDFDFYRARGTHTVRDTKVGDDLEDWARELTPSEFTTPIVGDRIDLDNLARHLFVIMWCGVDDWAQGARVRDRRVDHPLWSWVHWDMDRAFNRSYPGQIIRPWQKAGMDLVLGVREVEQEGDRPRTFIDQQHSLRALLFKGLIANDKAFRDLFLRIAATSMNHLITEEWMEPLILELGEGLEGKERGRAIGPARSFMKHRSQWMRDDICALMGSGSPVRIRLRVPTGIQLEVDGYPVGPRYIGWYFPGQMVRLTSAEPIGWVVDGVRFRGTTIEVEAQGDMLIFARP